MNDREMLELAAREAGLYVEPHGGGNWAIPLVQDLPERLQTFAAIIRKQERERCAKVCDAADKSTHPSDLADAIRAMED